MLTKTRKCPHCGETIDSNVNICPFCAEDIPIQEIETSKINCPYCGEEILSTAKKCKHCGEWLEKYTPKKSCKIDIKQFGTILISILATIIIVFIILNAVMSSYINADDLDSFTTYKSIIPSSPAYRELLTDYSQAAEYIQQMLNQENDLKEYCSKLHNKKDKTKLLHSFLINLEKINEYEILIRLNTKNPPKIFDLSGVELTLKYNEDNIPYYVISKPQIDFIEFRYTGTREFKNYYGEMEYYHYFIPEINYIYIQNKYKKHLTKDYAEYINCHKQFDTVFKHTTYISEKNSATVIDRIKLTFLYNKFLKQYPKFEGKKGIDYQTYDTHLYSTTVYLYYIKFNEEEKQAFEYYIKHAPKSDKYYNCIKNNYYLLKANNYEAPEDYNQKCCRLD